MRRMFVGLICASVFVATPCFADSSFRIIVKDTTASVLTEHLDATTKYFDFYKLFCLEFGRMLQSKYSDLKGLPIVVEISKDSKLTTFRFFEESTYESRSSVKELIVSLSYNELFYADLKTLGELSVRVEDRDISTNSILSTSSIRLMNTLSEIKATLQNVSGFFAVLSGRSSSLQLKEYRSFDSTEVSRASYRFDFSSQN